MRLQRPGTVGGIVGSLAALVLLGGGWLHPRAMPGTGRMLGEHGGTIHSLVLQYTAGSRIVWPVYRQFLSYQPAEVTAFILCPAQADFAEIQQAIGPVKCGIKPVFAGHAITTWARDRWVELTPPTVEAPITLLAPRGELEQEIWPARAGDSHSAEDLAKAVAPDVIAQRSLFYFDGGDFLADEKIVFATPAVLRRNLQHTAVDRQSLTDQLQRQLQLRVVFLDDAPDHHAGMYMMTIGDHRMLVGDPSLARSLLDADSPELIAMDGGPDFTPENQAKFDSVARLVMENGYRVTRIPVVPSHDAKRYLTFTNVIMDFRSGESIVYLPTYADQPRLNTAATAVWASMGYQVRPVECSSVWPEGGTLHCLVNVLRRGE